MAVLTVIGFATLGFSMLGYMSASVEINARISFLKNAGIVRKNLAFLNLYSNRISDSEPHYEYAALVSA